MASSFVRSRIREDDGHFAVLYALDDLLGLFGEIGLRDGGSGHDGLLTSIVYIAAVHASAALRNRTLSRTIPV